MKVENFVAMVVVAKKKKKKPEEELFQALHILRNLHAFSWKLLDPMSAFHVKNLIMQLLTLFEKNTALLYI